MSGTTNVQHASHLIEIQVLRDLVHPYAVDIHIFLDKMIVHLAVLGMVIEKEARQTERASSCGEVVVANLE